MKEQASRRERREKKRKLKLKKKSRVRSAQLAMGAILSQPRLLQTSSEMLEFAARLLRDRRT